MTDPYSRNLYKPLLRRENGRWVVHYWPTSPGAWVNAAIDWQLRQSAVYGTCGDA